MWTDRSLRDGHTVQHVVREPALGQEWSIQYSGILWVADGLASRITQQSGKRH
ncbi:hypothetical protein V5R04_05590 [Jonesiaceae bacterium BS-20]|uniref:Uncharacterized protein n=1 Tax=Jonesiaceae bacterium BS-20 TaxID=3120821 RepID=A0AAU7E0C0_9MICO